MSVPRRRRARPLPPDVQFPNTGPPQTPDPPADGPTVTSTGPSKTCGEYPNQGQQYMQCYVCKGLMLIAIGQPIAAFDTWVFGETAAGYQVAPAEVFMHPACLETLNKRG